MLVYQESFGSPKTESKNRQSKITPFFSQITSVRGLDSSQTGTPKTTTVISWAVWCLALKVIGKCGIHKLGIQESLGLCMTVVLYNAILSFVFKVKADNVDFQYRNTCGGVILFPDVHVFVALSLCAGWKGVSYWSNSEDGRERCASRDLSHWKPQHPYWNQVWREEVSSILTDRSLMYKGRTLIRVSKPLKIWFKTPPEAIQF